jgi:hypothetical protein
MDSHEKVTFLQPRHPAMELPGSRSNLSCYLERHGLGLVLHRRLVAGLDLGLNEPGFLSCSDILNVNM